MTSTPGPGADGGTPSPVEPPSEHHGRRILGMAAALLIGGALFWFGWVVLGADSQGDAGDAITTGTVVRVTPAADGAGCAAVARFEAKGRSYEATNEVRDVACPYRVGDEVRIAYRPADPADAELLDAGPITWGRWAAVLTGSVLLLIGGVGLVRSLVLRWRRPTGADATEDEGPG